MKLEKPENMPIDIDGNRADIVLDPASTISRMNIGRLYEHYVCGAARDVAKHIRNMLGIPYGPCSTEKISCVDDEIWRSAYHYLLSFYRIVSTKQYEFFNQLNDNDKLEHLASIVRDKIYLFIPVDNDIDSVEMVKNIEQLVKPTYGPVSYVGNSGRRITTVNNIRIAPMYIMLLDKTPDEWSSVSTGRLQHFGILSTTIKSEKFSFPFRNSPIRAYGETELRILNGYTDPENTAELVDRNNNPATMRLMYYNLLETEKSTNVDCIVDRQQHRLGNAKNLQIVRHSMLVTGIEIIYESED